ncbi:MAG: hypothetical protein IPM29_06005 [Planctomycetes bacterium]|nr:hypothetical protein [Planctomycetota bacterium]
MIGNATRAIEIAGITTNPDDAFTAQVARNLTDRDDRLLRARRFLIPGRDTESSGRFELILNDAGVCPVTTSHEAPNINAIAGRCGSTPCTTTASGYTQDSATR